MDEMDWTLKSRNQFRPTTNELFPDFFRPSLLNTSFNKSSNVVVRVLRTIRVKSIPRLSHIRLSYKSLWEKSYDYNRLYTPYSLISYNHNWYNFPRKYDYEWKISGPGWLCFDPFSSSLDLVCFRLFSYHNILLFLYFLSIVNFI